MSLDPEYLNVTGIVHTFENHAAESPAMLKKDGYYFIFSSGLSGWAPNDNVSDFSGLFKGLALLTHLTIPVLQLRTISRWPLV